MQLDHRSDTRADQPRCLLKNFILPADADDLGWKARRLMELAQRSSSDRKYSRHPSH